MTKPKIIRGTTEIHATTRWVPRVGEDGVSDLEIAEFRIDHRDGEVETALTAAEAIAKVSANIDRTRRKFEKRNPTSERIWITTVRWHGCPIGFEAPTLEIKS